MPLSLADELRRQLPWRSWEIVLDELPLLEGRTVLDLGCAVGDQAALLAARGARVIGFDALEELLAEARARNIPNATFHTCDLREELPPTEPADGLWSSFAAAYFPLNLSERIAAWSTRLRPGGWLAITEIDDLFGHEPVTAETRALFDGYADEALRAGRYDFRMGRRLEDQLHRAGLRVTRRLELPDAEFSATGPVSAEIASAWSDRFDRMPLLKTFCGPRFEAVRDDFLACLRRPDHRPLSRVICVLGERVT